MGLPPNPISIQVDQFKNFIVAYSQKGIYKYDPKHKRVVSFRPSNDPMSIRPAELVEIAIKDEFVWILHKDGFLERLNTRTKQIDIRKNYLNSRAINSIIPKSIFIDSDHMVWIYPGINNRGVVCYNKTNDQWKQYDIDTKPALSNSFVRGIVADRQGLIWIATDHGGLNLLDKKKNSIQVLRHNEYNKTSVGQNSIVSLYCDPQGIVWAGTYKNGVSYYHPEIFKFPSTGLSDGKSELFDCKQYCQGQSGEPLVGDKWKRSH
ncbi:hypothetical protein KUH03_40045 [Sphingobacterium sp. E70]|uniref:ligand-binding sensor domain-containing protein n=1 Tax=Sphingobacterium sp. E70 TaxID=2853439 RepID=UPI00211B8FE7|nr:two-component regulator propeller domain-containing protein [Sphingobacterium sp. E70]ULT24995.1 hypothetical protein KUH03_40045 [Sphingobacterium sp. E70]